MKKRIIVAGRNYCNILTTARALGEAGYEVEALKVFKAKPNLLKFLRRMKPEAHSRYVTRYTEVITNGDKAAVARALIGRAGDCEGALVIPVDDYVCCAIDEALDELSEHFVLPSVGAEQGGVVRLMDKSRQKKLAAQVGLPVLHSALIKSKNGELEIPEDIIYPCFIKPNISMRSTKSIMRKCSDRQELSRVLTKYASQEDIEILCEEFVDIKDEYSVLGLSTGERAFSAGILHITEGGSRDRKGVAITGELINPEGFEDIIEKCNRYVESLNYVGMFDIDLIQGKNGKIYFVELNFRAGASTYVLNKAGVNLYGIMADYLLNSKPVENIEPVNASINFVSEKVLMEEFARGDVSSAKVKECMNNAQVFFVKSSEDMKPYRYFRIFYLPSAILRLIYKAFHAIKGI